MTALSLSANAPDSHGGPIRIGVFDSGVGGLSVLGRVRERLPHARLRYVADSGHSPYGERSASFVKERSERVAAHLVEGGAQALVVACNTATAVAIQGLRERWPSLPIVGIEPGIKPALTMSRQRRVGVMATRATLQSAKFQALLAAHTRGSFVHLQPCDGLAAAIEHGPWDDPALLALIERHCSPMRAAEVDTVVLGCTHYPLVRASIQAALDPAVQVVDAAEGMVRRLESACAALGGATRRVEPWQVLQLEATGETAALHRIAAQCLGWNGVILSAGSLV